MATVRFSKELQDSIRASARGKMQPAIQRAQQSRPDAATWGPRIYDIMFSDVLPILNQVPAGWLNTQDAFEVVNVSGIKCPLQFSLGGSRPWPVSVPNTDKFSKAPHSYRINEVVLKEHPDWQELKAEVEAYLLRVRAAEARQAEFVQMVDKVINAYSTLAPALKAWPPLWDLIPEDVKDRHRRVVERTKEEVALDVDFNKLTALSTAAKLGV
jgi:hypothetical protein